MCGLVGNSRRHILSYRGSYKYLDMVIHMQVTFLVLIQIKPIQVIVILVKVFEYTVHVSFCAMVFSCIVIILNFRTDMPGQTVQTQIRLLLEEQSDQGLHCLPFRLHRLDSLLYGRAT